MWKLLGEQQFDWLVMCAYQMNLIFNIQVLFSVFIEYTPKTMCDGDHCFEVIKKCTSCPSCPNLCENITDAAQLAACKQKYDIADFYSPSMEFHTYCHSATSKFSVTSTQVVGLILGNIVLGFIADRIGRRFTLLFCVGLGIPNLIAQAFVSDVVYLYIFRFFLGISIGGSLSIGWTFCSEICSPKFRFRLETFTNYGNARFLVVLLTFLAGEWRLASILCGVVSCVTFAFVFLMPESPIWLKRRGKLEKAEKAAKRIAWLNGVEYETEEVSEAQPEKTNPTLKRMNMVSAMKNPSIRVNILVLIVMWHCCALSLYIIDFNGADMTTNLWMGQFMSCVLISVGQIIIGFADIKFAWVRRRTVFLGSVGGGIIAVSTLTVLHYLGYKGKLPYFIAYLAITMCAAISWEPCYLGASELVPTEIRATVTSFTNMFARVAVLFASILVGTLKSVHEPILFMVVIAVNLFSFCVSFKWLKETKNIDLDDIIEIDHSDGMSSMTSERSDESDSHQNSNRAVFESTTDNTESRSQTANEE